MTENRFVLDTNAVISLTTRGKVIPPQLENDLDRAKLFISIITEIELFAKPELPSDEEEKLHAFLSDRFTIIDIPDEIKKETIALRRSTKLKLPDCIIAATAINLNAVLLTDDARLFRLKHPGVFVRKVFSDIS